VAEIGRALLKGVDGELTATEQADAEHAPRLLRLRGDRRSEQHRTRASEERAPVHHSIT